MPRDGSNIYSKPAGTTAIAGTTIESAKYNAVIDDIATDLNTPRPIVAGGTGASSASAARTNLGLAIGTNVQAYDAGLASIAGLTTAANKMIYTTGPDVYATTDLSAFMRTVLDDADGATARVTLGLGSNILAGSSAVTDADAATDSGFWRTDGAAANIPEATIGVGLTSQYDASGLLQLWVSLTTGGIWYRKKNVTWSSWAQFTSSANFASRFSALPYVSSPQTITSGGLLTLAHGLGGVPSIIAMRARCEVAEGGWSVGDEVHLDMNQSDAGTTIYNSVWADATNIYVRYASVGPLKFANKTTGAPIVVTNANWRLIVRAYP